MNDFLQLFSEHNQKIAAAISILLIVLMSLSVAETVLVIMETMTPPAAIGSGAPSPTASVQPDYKVSNLELFGKLREASTTATEIVNAPETRLNLELQGVFIADEPNDSTAIIAEKSRTGELYGIDDSLPGNAILSAVFEDHVLIRRGGRVERLMFSDSAFRTVKAETPPSTPAVQPARGIDAGTRTELSEIRDRLRGRNEAREAAASGRDGSSEIAKYRQKIADDPVAALNEAGISPVTSGESKGYRVGDEAQPMIRQAGLQPGDVILSVNGRPVGNATSDSALVDQVMASSRVRVEVQRGERRFFLTVPVPK